MIKKSKSQKRVLAVLLSAAMAFTSVNMAPLSTVTAYAVETATIADGDYYIVNAATGKALNSGNKYGTQASVCDGGQLFTIKSTDGGYEVHSHYYNEDNKGDYLGANGYVDCGPQTMKIEKTESGNYVIISSEEKYLTASSTDTTVNFVADKEEKSEWKILTRDELITAAKKGENVSLTSLIYNYNFSNLDQYTDKWKMVASNKNMCGGKAANTCAESWHSAFELSQTLTGIPNGVYEVAAQGFYRQDNGTKDVAYIYANDVMGELNNREADGPNSMDAASEAFSAGRYAVEPIEVVVTDNQITLGAKTTSTSLWVIFDNFSLTLKEVHLTDDEAFEYADLIADKELSVSVNGIAKPNVRLNAANTIEGVTVSANSLDKSIATASVDDEGAVNVKGVKAGSTTVEVTATLGQKSHKASIDVTVFDAQVVAAIEKIKAIGKVTLTSESKEKIDAAQLAYDALTDEQKGLISSEELSLLEAAQEEYKKLETEANDAATAEKFEKGTLVISDVELYIKQSSEVAVTVEGAEGIKGITVSANSLDEAVATAEVDSDGKLVVTGVSAGIAKVEVTASFGKATPKKASFEVTVNGPYLTSGDYYIVNAKTGKLLNAGNSWDTQASAFTFGQLVTVKLNDSDCTKVSIDSHYKKNGKHYLGDNGFVDCNEVYLKTEKCDNGNIIIKNSEGKYLTASTDETDTRVTFNDTKSDESEWCFLTREEYIADAKAKAMVGEEVDITSLIYDPNFGQHNEYYNKWVGGPAVGGIDGSNGSLSYLNGEKYHTKCDIYQEIDGLPSGVYTLQVQGFARKDGEGPAPVYYINSVEKALKQIEDDASKEKVDGKWTTERNGVYVPNWQSEVAKCFEDGAYINEEIETVVTDGKIKLGIKSDSELHWVVFDNFNLKLKKAYDDTDVALLQGDISIEPEAVTVTQDKTKEIKVKLPIGVSADDVEITYTGANGDVIEVTKDEKDATRATIKGKSLGETSVDVVVNSKNFEKKATVPVTVEEKGSLVAKFDFENAAVDGVFVGDNAKATINNADGVAVVDDAERGNVLQLTKSAKGFLSVVDEDGKNPVAGCDEMTISYYSKDCSGWTFFTTPVETDQVYKQEKYVGFLQGGEQVEVQKWNNTSDRTPTATAKFEAGKWHHIVAVIGKNGPVVYVDGVKEAEAANDFALTSLISEDSAMWIGKANWSPWGQSGVGEFTDGLLDDIRVYNKALNADEVNALFLATATPAELKAAADKAAAKEVAEKIAAIGTVAYTDACKAAIDAAKAAYEALTDDQKALLTEEYKVLTAADEKYAELKAAADKAAADEAAAKAVADKIAAIGTVAYTDACKAAIDAAKAAYEALTDDQKALLTEEYKALTDAEAKYAELKKAADDKAAADAAVKVGDEKTVNELKFEVVSADKNEPQVAYTGTTKANAKNVSVPATVKVDGVEYKVTEIKEGAFKNAATLRAVRIPSGVTTIGKSAFEGCKKLRIVTIPSTVTKIDAGAFKNCKALYRATIPTSVTEIADEAFMGCSSLETITIPSGVTSIGTKAFYNCREVEKITVKSKAIKKVGKNAFKKINKACVIKVPGAKKKAYKKLFKKGGLATSVKVK